MRAYEWEVIGTHFSLRFLGEARSDEQQLFEACERLSREFDALYSRYIPESLVSRMARAEGTYEVPHDLVAMLRLYQTLYRQTGGLVTPTIGRTLEDIGLDAHYSLKEKAVITQAPDFLDAVHIDDDTHITLRAPVLLDVGALGKGYLVDRLHDFLREKGCDEFLVDGSGDIRYHSTSGTPIVCGLEHPYDTSLAIGTLRITGGALCASATNRRRWGTRHHYINPRTNESPETVVATWVYAQTAADADGLSTALFFVEPEQLSHISYEYLVVNAHLQKKNSAGFAAEFF